MVKEKELKGDNEKIEYFGNGYLYISGENVKFMDEGVEEKIGKAMEELAEVSEPEELKGGEYKVIINISREELGKKISEIVEERAEELGLGRLLRKR